MSLLDQSGVTGRGLDPYNVHALFVTRAAPDSPTYRNSTYYRSTRIQDHGLNNVKLRRYLDHGLKKLIPELDKGYRFKLRNTPCDQDKVA